MSKVVSDEADDDSDGGDELPIEVDSYDDEGFCETSHCHLMNANNIRTQATQPTLSGMEMYTGNTLLSYSSLRSERGQLKTKDLLSLK